MLSPFDIEIVMEILWHFFACLSKRLHRKKSKKPSSEWRKMWNELDLIFIFFDILRRHKNLENFLAEFSSLDIVGLNCRVA